MDSGVGTAHVIPSVKVASIDAATTSVAAVGCSWWLSSSENKALRWVWIAARASTAKRGVSESRSALALTCVLSIYNARPQTSFSRLSLFHNRFKEAPEHLHARLAHEYGSDWNDRATTHPNHSPGTTTRLGRSAAWRISCRSERSPSKNITSCSGAKRRPDQSRGGRRLHRSHARTRAQTTDQVSAPSADRSDPVAPTLLRTHE